MPLAENLSLALDEVVSVNCTSAWSYTCHTSDLRGRSLVVLTTTAFTDLATLVVRKVRHAEGGQV